MNKKVIPALLLLTVTTAGAVSPLIVGLVALGGIGFGAFITSYIMGLQQQVADLTQFNEFLNDTLSKEQSIAKETFSYAINSEIKNSDVIIYLADDFVEYSEPYAWTVAKYTALKTIQQELNNGTDFTTALSYAKSEAMDKVLSLYRNSTNNVVNDTNARYEKIRSLMIASFQAAHNALVAICMDSDGCPDWTGVKAVEFVDDQNRTWVLDAFWNPYFTDQDKTTYRIKVNGQDLGGCGPAYDCNIKSDPIDVTLTNMGLTVTINSYYSYGNNVNYYVINNSKVIDLLNQYDAEYAQISANLDAYLNGLTQTLFEQGNISDLLDPVTLATQINNDAETTGYYGYAAAELALLGLNLSGLNKTVTIDINGTTLSGILFTDWSGTLEVNKTYTADPSHLWYFIDENGQLYDLQGYNFTVVDLRDKNGNKLQNTTFERYVDHSGDIQKIYDELAKLNKLYQKYIEMQTVAGGGSGGVGDWWANLSDTEKLAIGAAAVLLIVLIARK